MFRLYVLLWKEIRHRGKVILFIYYFEEFAATCKNFLTNKNFMNFILTNILFQRHVQLISSKIWLLFLLYDRHYRLNFVLRDDFRLNKENRKISTGIPLFIRLMSYDLSLDIVEFCILSLTKFLSEKYFYCLQWLGPLLEANIQHF